MLDEWCVMDNYKELKVWQRAVELVEKVYKISRTFPKEERFGLVSQLQRSAVSVPANIAEGWGRGTTQEYIYFLRVARGSLMELETHLIITQRIYYPTAKPTDDIFQEIEVIGKMINGLIGKLKSDGSHS